MKNPEKAAFYTLVISTICVVLISLPTFLRYLESGDPGGTFSNICFLASDICIVFSWIQYFRNKRKK